MSEPFGSETPWHEDESGTTTLVPQRQTGGEREATRQPRYHVILWDSNDHTFDYVHQMLRELFGHTKEACQQIAESVDTEGRATVLTTTKEHAELKRDQIHAFGKDPLIRTCKGSMSASIEPLPE